ncbi:PREDICTED: NEP1-interacting protein-like 1 isoform X2 [Ipomoea nil]|uniref:NEP1-interacting protein-like 1 isoform X2 n=1 Tax=Ipomoea nil TaxID=35883 RepID=UPI000901E986|nr:PREDICTED: NEP1-interacting protein-like 1 isoform X2 [Ipomoea nil]
MNCRLFSRIIEGLMVKSRGCLSSSWIPMDMVGSASRILFMVFNNAVWSLFMCVLALGGATVGIVTGALKGQTTETGLLRGAAVGAVAGAITAVQLFELMLNGEPFSKVALVCSLVDGKVFMDWVCPAVLKAYQWQVSTMETSLRREITDIFEINGSSSKGLSHDIIQKLPEFMFQTSSSCPYQDISCAICLQEFKNGESGRMLPSCSHSFHIHCVDQWLIRHGSCPMCRTDV